MNEFELVDSDIALLRAARTDPDAFGDFYRRHAVAVERWIRAQTPDMATAADLTAEASVSSSTTTPMSSLRSSPRSTLRSRRPS
jgi:DNA-directed RNA polymerase specialized sigma24 family protein